MREYQEGVSTMEFKTYVDCLSAETASAGLLLEGMKYVILNDELYPKDSVKAYRFEFSIALAEACVAELVDVACTLKRRDEEQLDVGSKAKSASNKAALALCAFEVAKEALEKIPMENKEGEDLVTSIQITIPALLSNIVDISREFM